VTVDQSDALIVTERALVDVADKPVGEPARLGFIAPDRAVVTNGPRKGERVEFLRERGAVAWLRWDGRIARRQSR
jgi:hypothetical protein